MKIKEKSANWIQKTHLFRPDEFICSSCRASFKKPCKNCPACGIVMRANKYDPSWVDEAELLDIFLGGF